MSATLSRAPSIACTPSSLAELRGLAESGPFLFAVLDACGEPRVPLFARQLGERAVSLYRGDAERDFWDIAPYLIQLDGAALAWIVETLGERPFGIFALFRGGLAELRRHFRRFLLVEGQDQQELYFRFYDPRVLPLFLNSASGELAATFFGPIESLFVVSEDQELLQLQLTARLAAGARPVRKLVFSAEELNVLASERRRVFRERLIAHLAQQLRERPGSIEPRELAGQVDEGLRRAQRYELTSQRDIARYLEVMCIKLGGFTHRPDPLPAQNILFDRRLTTTERLDQLDAWAGAQLR